MTAFGSNLADDFRRQAALQMQQNELQRRQQSMNYWDNYRTNLRQRNEALGSGLGFVPTQLQFAAINRAGGDVNQGLADYASQDAAERQKMGLPAKFGASDAYNNPIRPLGGAPMMQRLPMGLAQRVNELNAATAEGMTPAQVGERAMGQDQARAAIGLVNAQATELGGKGNLANAQATDIPATLQGRLGEMQGRAGLYGAQANQLNTQADIEARAALNAVGPNTLPPGTVIPRWLTTTPYAPVQDQSRVDVANINAGARQGAAQAGAEADIYAAELKAWENEMKGLQDQLKAALFDPARQNAIQAKIDAKEKQKPTRRGASSGGGQSTGRVTVVDPSGKRFTIPENQVEAFFAKNPNWTKS